MITTYTYVGICENVIYERKIPSTLWSFGIGVCLSNTQSKLLFCKVYIKDCDNYLKYTYKLYFFTPNFICESAILSVTFI